MCGIVITHENGEIKSIKGDKEDPFSKGFICPKAVALQDIYTDLDRLKKPLKKINGQWNEISWDQAIDEVGEKLLEIKKKHGNSAIGVYNGNPSVHNYGTMLFNSYLVRALGIKNKFSATSVDQLPHHMASQFMFGHALLIPIPDIDRTDFFLVLGANPMVSNGSLMTAAGMPKRIRALQERGGKMVVIDPRRSETAEKADQHFHINPGADVFLLMGMIHVILKEDLHEFENLKKNTKDFDDLKSLLLDFDLNLVELNTSISVADVEKLARDFAEAKSAVCYGRMGVSTQQHGSLCQWLINVLNCITGNFDRAGGALFNTPAVDVVKNTAAKGTMRKFNRWQSKVRKLPEFGGELPVATLAEEILEAGDDRIRAMITSAGNPVLSTPNGQKLDKALESLDFMVSIDIYLNETTRHADYILPPTTGLETDHYDLIFNLFAVRNVAKYSEPLFDGAPDSKQDWQIFKALKKRIRSEKSLTKRWFENWSTPKRLLNLALLSGPYGLFKGGLNLRKLRNKKHGIDLGALQSSVPKRLFTKDKKIDLVPYYFKKGIEELLKQNEESSAGGLRLIGRRHLRSNNSWMHNTERLVKGGERCTLLMHPDDAKERGLENALSVKVASRVGEVQAALEISDEIMRGVVSLPHGWGHNRKGIKMKTAQEHAGVSVNDLTDELFIDQLSGNAALSGVEVKVENC